MLNKYIDLPDGMPDKLNHFYELHMKATLNLTAIKDRNEFYIKHYLDSILLFQQKTLQFKTLIDVGSGGGFPGIVLALFYPERQITLCESIKKKCAFLEETVHTLGVENVSVINDRVENVKGKRFDMITARGVSRVLDMMKKTKNVSRETSTFVFYKGEKLDEELKEANYWLKKNKMRVENVRIESPFKRTYCVIGTARNSL